MEKVETEEIILTMTTGTRLDLFIRTMESFLTACQDKDLISRWIVSDDRSSTKDLFEMKDRYSFLEIYPSPEPGQLNSLIHVFSIASGTAVNPLQIMKPGKLIVFTLEDDWDFIRPGHFIREALAVMREDGRVRNVVLRGWKSPLILNNGQYYHLHAYYYPTGELADQFKEITKTTDCLWPSYSCNPGLQDINSILPILKEIRARKVADLCWENETGKEFIKRGFRRANLTEKYIQHMGGERTLFKKSWKV